MMNIPRVLAAVAMAAACGTAALSQQQPSGYHGVLCLKVNPGKGADYRKWYDEEGRKVLQANVDSGKVTTVYRLRAVAPAGTAATCDFLGVSLYPGFPEEPPAGAQLEALLRKAGISGTVQDFVNRRDSFRTVVSAEIFQNQLLLGSIKKGDYVSVSYMKTAHVTDWLTMERTIWQPIADAMIKDGIQSGWSVNLEIFPNGEDMPYQGVSVDVYPSLAAAIKGQNLDTRFDELFKRVHPGLDENSTLDNALKTRMQSRVYLFQVEDVVQAAK